MEWKTLVEPDQNREKLQVSVTRSGFRIGTGLIEKLGEAARAPYITVDLATFEGEPRRAEIRFTDQSSAYAFPASHAYKENGSLKSVTVNASQLGRLLSGNQLSGTLRLPAREEDGKLILSLGEAEGGPVRWQAVENLSAKMRVRVRITPDGIRMGRGIIRKLGKAAELPYARVEIKKKGDQVMRIRLVLTDRDLTTSFSLNRSGRGNGRNCPWDMIGVNSRTLSRMITNGKTLNYPAEVRGNEITIVTDDRPADGIAWETLDRDFGMEKLSLVVTKNAVKIPKRIYTRIEGIESMNYALIAYRRLEDGLYEARITFLKDPEKEAVRLSWRGGSEEMATSLEIPSKALCALIAPEADPAKGERVEAEIEGDELYLKQAPTKRKEKIS